MGRQSRIRTAEGPSSNINAVGLQNPGVDHYLEDDLPKLKAINATVIANVAGHCETTMSKSCPS